MSQKRQKREEDFPSFLEGEYREFEDNPIHNIDVNFGGNKIDQYIQLNEFLALISSKLNNFTVHEVI